MNQFPRVSIHLAILQQTSGMWFPLKFMNSQKYMIILNRNTRLGTKWLSLQALPVLYLLSCEINQRCIYIKQPRLLFTVSYIKLLCWYILLFLLKFLAIIRCQWCLNRESANKLQILSTHKILTFRLHRRLVTKWAPLQALKTLHLSSCEIY